MNSKCQREIERISDPLIRQGVEEAIGLTLGPALMERAYPGHYTVTADGGHFGTENTWPGLDSWELGGAYLLLGQSRPVIDYFDFVQASQRPDGNIPFAIFPADAPPPQMDTFLRHMRWPEDIYTYQPVPRDGRPAHSCLGPRKWIGLYTHWQPKANPLSMLGPISHIMTGVEIFDATKSLDWLKQKMESLELAAHFVLSRKSPSGLISGAGFYMESPPRNQWDGITQCYAIHAFRLLAGLHDVLGENEKGDQWRQEADNLLAAFQAAFWRDDHFGEYIHPDHGLVDHHGLTDVDWASIALQVATPEQAHILWPRLTSEKGFWYGNMPTQVVTKPWFFHDWEFSEPLPFSPPGSLLYDVAAMGRVWYLEAQACLRMGDHERLRESVRLVCRMGERHGWQWHERYHRLQVQDVYAAGPKGYCEYAAILIRTVVGNLEIFA